MAAVRTSLVTRKHAWTGVDVPWCLDTESAPPADAPEAARRHWRLFQLLSGGGLSACGLSSEQALVDRRQGRFLVFAGVLGVLWIIFWII